VGISKTLRRGIFAWQGSHPVWHLVVELCSLYCIVLYNIEWILSSFSTLIALLCWYFRLWSCRRLLSWQRLCPLMYSLSCLYKCVGDFILQFYQLMQCTLLLFMSPSVLIILWCIFEPVCLQHSNYIPFIMFCTFCTRSPKVQPLVPHFMPFLLVCIWFTVILYARLCATWFDLISL